MKKGWVGSYSSSSCSLPALATKAWVGSKSSSSSSGAAGALKAWVAAMSSSSSLAAGEPAAWKAWVAAMSGDPDLLLLLLLGDPPGDAISTSDIVTPRRRSYLKQQLLAFQRNVEIEAKSRDNQLGGASTGCDVLAWDRHAW